MAAADARRARAQDRPPGNRCAQEFTPVLRMGKDGFMTPKAIANRIKAKGLQRLRWYCQLCEKQCRDANGFKCHCESESHQRNMVLFAGSAGRIINQYSREFETNFMSIVKRRAKHTFQLANLMYQELISDRQHTHMNATCWVTLSNFVRYLGREGKCVVEERPKGWYIKYNEKDPEVLAKHEALDRVHKHEADEEDRYRQYLEAQVKRAQQQDATENVAMPTARQPTDDTFSFDLDLTGGRSAIAAIKRDPKLLEAFGGGEDEAAVGDELLGDEDTNADEDDEKQAAQQDEEDMEEAAKYRQEIDEAIRKRQEMKLDAADDSNSHSAANNNAPPQPPAAKHDEQSSSVASTVTAAKKEERKFAAAASVSSATAASKRKLTALDEIILEQEKKKERSNRKDYWLQPNVVVKVMNKQLAEGKYYKKKGVVDSADKFVGTVRMLDDDIKGHVLKLDQSQLETVVPAIGGHVKIVNGAYRGCTAVLQSVNVDRFYATVRIDAGPHNGRVVDALPYEDFSKLYM